MWCRTRAPHLGCSGRVGDDDLARRRGDQRRLHGHTRDRLGLLVHHVVVRGD